MKWIAISVLFIACNSKTKSNKDLAPIFSSYLEYKFCADFYVFNDSMLVALTENYSPMGRPANYCEYYINVENKNVEKTKNCFIDSVHIESLQNEHEIELNHPILKYAKLDYDIGSRGYIANTAIIFTDKKHNKVCTFNLYNHENARVSHLYTHKNYLIILGDDVHERKWWTWLHVYNLNAFVD